MTRPPALPELVLGQIVADPDLRDAVLGDLAEEYLARCASGGAAAASSWYWRATSASFGPLAFAAQRRASFRSWARGGLASATGCAAFLTLVSVTQIAFRNLLIVPAISGEPVPIVLVLGAGACYGVLAGWFTGAVARHTLLASVTALGAAILALNMTALLRGVAVGPLWYWLGFGLAACGGTLAGGWFRLRRLR